MKWTRVNANCIQSGPYRISRYTLGGIDYYEVYHGTELIGDAQDGNRARKIAMRHSDKTTEKQAIGGEV